MSKTSLFIGFMLCCTSIAHAQCSPTPSVPAVWDISYATLHAGISPKIDGIALDRGIACRPDLEMGDGVIEFELGPSGYGFAGIPFRMQSAADYEIIYFRSNEDGRWAGVQYQPVYEGETTWQLYPGDGYEALLPQHAAHTRDGWTKVRLVIAGRRADVYFGDDTAPVLRVHELKRARASGSIGVWAARADSNPIPTAAIRSLRIKPLGRLSLLPIASDLAPANQLMSWRVSPRFAAPDSNQFANSLAADIRRATTLGEEITAEPSGLVNLTATIGNPAGQQKTNVFGGAGWGVAYASVTLRADAPRAQRLALSYSEAVGVYLDGHLVYVGDNRYESRSAGNYGVVGHEAETVVLRLHSGDNEVVLAVVDKAFGWGFRARLVGE